MLQKKRVKGVYRIILSLALVVFSVALALGWSAHIAAGQEGATRYVYDANGRLHAVIAPNGEATVYEYDAAGNIVSVTRTAANVLSVLGFNPTRGGAGTVVTVYGTGFSSMPGANTVRFNGVQANVTAAGNGALTVEAPAGAATGPISVTASSGTATSAGVFTVCGPSFTGFTPAIADVGQVVTINGANFDPNPSSNELTFNITNALVSSATAASLTTTVTPDFTSGRVTLETDCGRIVGSNDFFVPPPPFTAANVEETGRLALNQGRAANLSGQNKIGLFVFDAAPGQKASLVVNGMSLNRAGVKIYDPRGQQIVAANPFRAELETVLGGYLETPTLQIAGSYTILVASEANAAGSLSFNLYDASDQIINVSPDAAPRTVTATVPGRNTRLLFNGVAGQRVSFLAANAALSNGNQQLAVSLLRPNGAALVSGVELFSGGRYFSEAVTLPQTGVYTVLLDPLAEATGSVTLTLYDVPPDVSGSITPGGPAVTAANTAPGQNARYTFIGAANQRARLKISDLAFPAAGAARVSLLRPDGTVMIESLPLNAGATVYLDTQTLPVAGLYTVLYDPQDVSVGQAVLKMFDVPPDVSGTAAIGGPSVTVNITGVGQQARVTFNASQGQRVTVNLENLTIPWTDVSVIKPDDATLTQTAVNTNGGIIDIQTAPATGLYTLLFTPQGEGTGSVTVRLTTSAANGVLTFNGADGRRVNARLSNTDSFHLFTLRDPSNLLLETVADAGRAAYIYRTLTANGTYTATVTPQGGPQGNLIITVSDALPDDTTALVFGTPQDSSLLLLQQNLWFSFNGVANRQSSLETFYNGDGFLHYTTTVFDPQGAVLLEQTDFIDQFGGSFLDSFRLPVSGKYFARLTPLNLLSTPVNLRLRAVDCTDIETAIIPDGPPVNVAPGGFTHPLQNPPRPGQNAKLTFNGAAGQRVFVTADYAGPVLDGFRFGEADISLLAPAGATLGESLRLGREGCCGFITNGTIDTVTLPENGAYTLFVNPPRASQINANLRLYTVPPDLEGQLVIGGPQVSVNIAAAGQNANYTFAAAGQQHLSLAIGNNTIAGVAKVYRPDGSLLSSHPLTPGNSVIDLPDVLAAGAYRLVVDPAGAGAGGVQLQLAEIADVTATLTVNGPPVTVTTANSGQNARLTFNGNAAQNLTLAFSNPALSLFYVSVYRPDGTPFLAPRPITGGVPETVALQDLPDTGNYYVIIDPVGDETGAVTLALTEINEFTGAFAYNGAALPVTLQAGQTARLTLTGVPDRGVCEEDATYICHLRVFIQVADSTLENARITVSREGGATLAENVAMTNGKTAIDINIRNIIDAPATQNYTVLIEPAAGFAGGFNIAAADIGEITTDGGFVSVYNYNEPFTTLTFQGNSGDDKTLHIAETNFFDGQLEVKKPDGTVLATVALSEMSNFSLPLSLPATGVYKIVVTPGDSGFIRMALTSGGSSAQPKRGKK
jgi:YD repeat-containing protein